MLYNEYASDKVREIERELAARHVHMEHVHDRRTPVLGPVFRAAGRTLRRAGEGLESWAATAPTRHEHRLNFD